MFNYFTSTEYPAYDTEKLKDKTLVHFYVPGLDKEDISVSTRPFNRTIEIEHIGEKKKGRPVLYNNFKFQIPVSHEHDLGGVKAAYVQGVLILTIPLRAENKTKIKIE